MTRLLAILRSAPLSWWALDLALIVGVATLLGGLYVILPPPL